VFEQEVRVDPRLHRAQITSSTERPAASAATRTASILVAQPPGSSHAYKAISIADPVAAPEKR